MKLLNRFIAIAILLHAATISMYADCGNDNGSGCAGNKCCPPCTDIAPCAGKNLFFPYTGNVRREIRDLQIWGGVGDMQLTWTRYYNSRNGWEIWTNSYDYSLSDAGLNSQGQAQLLVRLPEGDAIIFVQSTGDPNSWLPPKGVDKRLFQQGNNYFLQRPNGYRYRFEKISSPIYGFKYQFQDFRDSYQNLYTLTYDAWHNLLEVAEPGGRLLSLEYTTISGKLMISKVRTSDGRSVSYNYTLYNDGILNWLLLTSVLYGDGTKATYEYAQSSPGRLMLLAHAIDPRLMGDAVNMRYTYDINVAEGFVKQELNGLTGEVIATLTTKGDDRWVCYSNGRVQHYVEPESMLGETTEYTDGLGRTTKWAFDAIFGLPENIKDPLARVTLYTRSAYSNYLQVVHPDGGMEKWTRDNLDLMLTYTDELGHVTTYIRDALHRVTSIIYPNGTDEKFTYNSFGQVLTHTLRNAGIETNTYDGRGLKTSFKDALGNISSYAYDGSDRLALFTDARGNTSKYEYNERGLRIKIVNADNSSQQFGYDDFGNRILITNELGNSWKKMYDEFKRTVSKTDPLNRQTKFNYDLPGGVCGCSHGNSTPTRVILPSGKTITIEYDPEWQKIKETVGAGSPEAATAAYEYDAAGNLTAIIDPRGEQWVYNYDARNHLKSEIDPLGHTNVWTYDAAENIIGFKRPDNGIYTYQYDNMNRPIQGTDPKGQATKILYEAEGNVSKMTDPSNRDYNFEYDLLNRLTKMIYPGGSFERHAYDAVSNLKTYTNRSGDVHTYTYDNRNREINSTWSDNTPSITRSYDAVGRVVTQSSIVSQLSYTYDNANELTGEEQFVSGTVAVKRVGYSYNADGLRKSMSYPVATGSSMLNYDYTERNQLSSITLNSEYLVSYGYDLNGNRIAQFRKNAVGTAYDHDDANRTLSITHQKGGVSFAHFDYGYDNTDRRTFVRRDYGKGDAYAYDATDQVTGVQYEATNPGGAPSGAARTVNYTYDPSGNRVNVTDNASTTGYITNSLNQYTDVGASPLTYNGNGALQSFSGWTYTYDAQNRLIKAQNATNTVNFAYDARNRCVKRTINGADAFLYYDSWNLIEEYNAANALVAQYIHGSGVDELLTKSTSGNMLFYHHDAQGNVTQLTNAAGNVVEQYSYDVFGMPAIKNSSGNLIPASAFGNRFLFTGREFIREIALYDYRNRMYSPALGRFVQSDPIKFSARDFNLYRYVFNNPVNNSDPGGLECCTWWQQSVCAGLGGAGGVIGGAIGAFAGPEIGAAGAAAAGYEAAGPVGAVAFAPFGAAAGAALGAPTGMAAGAAAGYYGCCEMYAPCPCKK
jgi:RHS repeat-associated protein